MVLSMNEEKRLSVKLKKRAFSTVKNKIGMFVVILFNRNKSDDVCKLILFTNQGNAIN